MVEKLLRMRFGRVKCVGILSMRGIVCLSSLSPRIMRWPTVDEMEEEVVCNFESGIPGIIVMRLQLTILQVAITPIARSSHFIDARNSY